MRLLFLSTWFPYPPDNGSKIRVYHLLRALSTRHRVCLLSYSFGTSIPEEADELQRCCEDVRVVSSNPFDRGRLLRWLRFLSPSPIVSRPLPEMTRAVRVVLDNTVFDAVIASTGTMARYALLTPQTTTKVLEEHNSHLRWSWERYQNQTSFVQRLRRWVSWQKLRRYEAWLFPKFDLCTMVSQQDREASASVLPGLPTRIEVVPNGVDCEHNRPGIADSVPNTLVYNGALTYSANYDAMQYFLARIYPRIRQEVPGVSLTITGSLEGVGLANLRLDESVNLSGYVEDVRPLVASSAACVIPLRQGGGTRIKILEAMALGTPVISTSKGAEGLAVEEGEHLLVADDPEAFAMRTVGVLQDRAMRDRLAASARRLVERRYDWEQIGDQFVSLVEEAALAHKRNRL